MEGSLKEKITKIHSLLSNEQKEKDTIELENNSQNLYKNIKNFK
jgi:hypothetical protein